MIVRLRVHQIPERYQASGKIQPLDSRVERGREQRRYRKFSRGGNPNRTSRGSRMFAQDQRAPRIVFFLPVPRGINRVSRAEFGEQRSHSSNVGGADDGTSRGK